MIQLNNWIRIFNASALPLTVDFTLEFFEEHLVQVGNRNMYLLSLINLI
jgi:hypothetical protein